MDTGHTVDKTDASRVVNKVLSELTHERIFAIANVSAFHLKKSTVCTSSELKLAEFA